jgi:phospho-N-acetylmuramoyl-pentapeptide-transferase
MYYLFAGAAVLSGLLTGPLLFYLRWISARQTERAEGPSSHKSKEGTPTMGGLGFILTIIVFSLFMVDFKYVPLLFLMAGFALIGFLDDLLKIVRGHNLGLTFWQKIITQTIFAGFFSFYILNLNIYSWFGIFIIVGSANATNLTDGLDGLLAGCSILAFLSFGLVCFKQALIGGSAFSFITAGALFGFLWFNFPKAKLFMGDVGSLSIGAALAGLAIITRNEWLLAVIGGVFLIEALSVIIQVTAYKLFKKRVFRMAPLHHHFELLGSSEVAVVLGFWFFQLILSILGAFLG